MGNIFAEKDEYSPNLKRNAFDLSFQNNLTLPFGKIVPIFCKEVLPNDSWDIDCALGLNFMPMIYPVQSKIYVNVHFYYVRNRALWKDWKDFIFKTKDGLVPPYISLPSSSNFWGDSSLSDYFGVPTSFDVPQTLDEFYVAGGASSVVNPDEQIILFTTGDGDPIQNYTFDSIGGLLETLVFSQPPTIAGDTYLMVGSSDTNTFDDYVAASRDFTLQQYADSFLHSLDGLNPGTGEAPIMFMPIPVNIAEPVFEDSDVATFGINLGMNYNVTFERQDNVTASLVLYTYDSEDGWIPFDNPISCRCSFSRAESGIINCAVNVNRAAIRLAQSRLTSGSLCIPVVICNVTSGVRNNVLFTLLENNPLYVKSVYVNGKVRRSSIVSTQNPFANDATPDGAKIRISALPFRAYESIFNAYYRNQQNDPFKINGEIEYNRFITNDEGGADSVNYDFFSRYWEPDFLTSAMPSPQQGVAPLVGVNAAGVFTFKNPETQDEYQAQALIGEDGETLTGIGVHSPDLPAGSLRALMTAVQHGMSINDFRNVNSLQRWLETNLRRGYKYRDLMNAHFGIDIRYNELDMPEFIGGLSTLVDVQKVVNQTASTNSASLGSFAGLPVAFGQFKNRIQKFCDEHGFIIGVMSVCPVPTYTQVIPKFYLKDNTLDYYSPEFAKIGMQPIFNSEVSPILAASEDKINDVFGYQRAWYDYMSSVDEAHGDFRNSLRNYVMYRTFGSTPELGKSFLDIDMSQVNDVFADTTNTDKILGRIMFKVTKKCVIPRHIIPGLE